MSKVQTLRALVNERLAAAAEEISALLERTTAEHEEELCRSEEANERTQRLLDLALSRRVQLNPGLDQDFTDTAWIKEEAEEEVQLLVSVPESGAVRVKTEESSELQQTEHEEETQGEAEHSSDTDDNWEPPLSRSCVQMETEADEEHHNQVQSRDRSTRLSPNNNKSAPEAAAHNGEKSGPDGAEREKKHQCSVCKKRFGRKWTLHDHIRVHTGEKPYRCSTCNKAFALRSNLITHKRTHTGEKPYSCSTCNKAFRQQAHLTGHRRTHTGEKPYCCPSCNKAYAHRRTLKKHMSAHHSPERDERQSV